MPLQRRFFVTFGEYRAKIFQKLALENRIENKAKHLNGNHSLAAALEQQYSHCLVGDGVATGPDGFYIDAFILKEEKFIQSRLQQTAAALMDSKRIETDLEELMSLPHHFITPEEAKFLPKLMVKWARKPDDYECIRVSKERAMEMFIYSPLKLYQISKIPDCDEIVIFKHGFFIDLWKDSVTAKPESTVNSALITNMGASQASPNHPQNLNRIHAITFSNAQDLQAYKAFQEEATRRNHKRIGQSQSLFTFHHYSPGAPFFLPHGTRILSSLKTYLRQEYKHFGFEEVITPLIFDKQLWEVSGHWQNYKQDMFLISSENQTAIKPMNCPGHCLLFASSGKSYRELPLRFAEFSPLHR
jgi:threonyl-tRNA synthetase